MIYRKFAIQQFDNGGSGFSRTTPPSLKTPWVPVFDIIPAIPSKTDQEDRERELKKRFKPFQYKSLESPDRGLSYHDVYPVTRKGPKEGEAEMAGQPFEFLNSLKPRFFLGVVDTRPKRPRFRKQLDYGIPDRREENEIE